MKKHVLYLFIIFGLHWSVSAQISTKSPDGYVTITPSGLESKHTGGSNSDLNVGIGLGALFTNKFATRAIAIGPYALNGLSSGTATYQVNNVAIGPYALFRTQPSSFSQGAASDGSNNVGIGANALLDNRTGSYNVAIGDNALASNTTSYNTGVGGRVLFNNTTGSNNSGFGYGALVQNTIGSNNIAFGTYSLYRNSTASANVAIGAYALFTQFFDNNKTTFLSYNVAVGYNALMYNNSTTVDNGIRNTAIGGRAMESNQTGFSNTSVGSFSLKGNTQGSKNVAIGDNALFTQNFANGNFPFESKNVAVGSDALYSNNPTDVYNGINNTAVGYRSMRDNTTGYSNVSIGADALSGNNTGRYNTAIGQSASAKNTTGIQNVAIGDFALSFNETGSNNVAIGNEAGAYEQGSDKLYIDNSSTQSPLIGGDFNSNVVGIHVSVADLAINPGWKLQVGGDINASGNVRAAGVVLTSDKRFKQQIRPIKGALDAVAQLNSYTYYWRGGEFPLRNFSNKQQMGLIAQEVETLFPDLIDSDAEGYKSVNYLQLTPLMIEAIKELKKENEALKARNGLLESRLDKIEALLNAGSATSNTR